MEGVSVYHAGTKMADGEVVTAGGRVLGVTAVGPDFESARKLAYQAGARSAFRGRQMRRDIGASKTVAAG